MPIMEYTQAQNTTEEKSNNNCQSDNTQNVEKYFLQKQEYLFSNARIWHLHGKWME